MKVIDSRLSETPLSSNSRCYFIYDICYLFMFMFKNMFYLNKFYFKYLNNIVKSESIFRYDEQIVGEFFKLKYNFRSNLIDIKYYDIAYILLFKSP